VLKTATVQKITAYTKVTEEALEDIPFMEDAIRTDLIQKLMLYEDAQILAGSGTGTPTQLKGILEFATAFNVTDSVNAEFYHKIQDANDLDVLRIAIALVAKAHGSPNYICLNPADVALMDVTKTTNGAYILPPFTTADGTKFKGCTIIENTGITAGTFLVMDSSKVNYKVRKDYDLAVGYDDDDFTNNRITIRAELRGVLYVKGNDTGCVIDGTFATCKAMITSGAATQNVAIVSPLNEDLDAVQMEEKTE
jgi:HK97 family phage major capsid protein